jgi:hypothetical protein
MTEIRVGDTVLYNDHAYVVRGISPMGAMQKHVMLEEPDTHELVDALIEDLRLHGEDEA